MPLPRITVCGSLGPAVGAGFEVDVDDVEVVPLGILMLSSLKPRRDAYNRTFKKASRRPAAPRRIHISSRGTNFPYSGSIHPLTMY